MKIYLDTSVISAYFDTKKEVRYNITKNWFDLEYDRFECFISDLVISELQATPDLSLRKSFIDFTLERKMPRLEINLEIENLAAEYRRDTIPNEINDSIHLAAATLYNFEAIASWNFKHIVNLETIRAIHLINEKNGLPIVEIVSLEQIGGNKYGQL